MVNDFNTDIVEHLESLGYIEYKKTLCNIINEERLKNVDIRLFGKKYISLFYDKRIRDYFHVNLGIYIFVNAEKNAFTAFTIRDEREYFHNLNKQINIYFKCYKELIRNTKNDLKGFKRINEGEE